MDPLSAAMKIAGSGLEAQSTRLRIVSENIANARSTGDTPGADPYRRKTITFGQQMDRTNDVETVGVKKVGVDEGDFSTEFDPSNPAADKKGVVKLPNVNIWSRWPTCAKPIARMTPICRPSNRPAISSPPRSTS